jgi:L-fucose mutarotase/ribose pyranase (RbsD/FucU family)
MWSRIKRSAALSIFIVNQNKRPKVRIAKKQVIYDEGDSRHAGWESSLWDVLREQARNAYAVLATTEPALYVCLIIKKGTLV